MGPAALRCGRSLVVMALLGLMILLIAFPEIALYLPETMEKW